MPNDYQNSRRTVTVLSRCEYGPKKLIIEIYEDRYTVLDAIAALASCVLEDPLMLESFRAYVDDGGGGGSFTGEQAEWHLRDIIGLMLTVWGTPPSVHVYVSTHMGWVN